MPARTAQLQDAADLLKSAADHGVMHHKNAFRLSNSGDSDIMYF
jgi:hypothetical protein